MTDAELLSAWMECAGGLSQAEAAAILKLKQPNVSKVITGKSHLSPSGRAFVEHLLQDAQRPAVDAAVVRRLAEDVQALLAQVEAMQQSEGTL